MKTKFVPGLFLTLLFFTSLAPLHGEETVIYKQAGGRELKLFLEKPSAWKASDHRPAMVFFFGGGWVGGSPAQFLRQSQYLATRGMVGIRVEYRTIPKGDQGPPTVCCADAKSAMRYVRSHAAELGVDPRRIAAAGGSAGGHLAAFTGLVDGLDDSQDDPAVSCKPDALVLFNPVFNNGPGQWGYERVGSRFKEFSPAHNITRKAPPTIVFLGEADKLIPVSVLKEFETGMKQAGIRCDARVYPNAGHGFFNRDPHFTLTLVETDKFLASLGWLPGPPTLPAARPGSARVPNLVYILCDDLGYGDVHALNPQRGKIATPNLDQLRAEGMAFTDCHSSSAVCTPSRYSILTGRYAWRSRLQSGVLGGESEPLIAPGRLTAGELLRRHGYTTAALGKWHLGLRFDPKDFTRPISDGPLQHGFDYFFGIAASLDMPPFVYIENNHFTEVPSVTKKWVRSGPAAPDFEAMDVLPKLTAKAADYLAARGADQKTFFLYLALPSPHTPLVPSKEWQGKSPLGPYGDYVMETDWAVGEVLKAIERAGLRDNTLVLFTSDNGCAPYIGVAQLESQGHYPSAQFRGYKSDIWDGGHRIPFLVRWPGKIKPGSQSDQLVCLSDLLATCADLLGERLPDNAGEDSVSILPALLGADQAPLHEAIVNHSINGRFAIRQGDWKLELCPGSGGWEQPKDAVALKQGLPLIQLYDLHDDIGERVNLQAKDLEIVTRLTKLLENYVANGRSTPGAPQQNDGPVDIWKKKLNGSLEAKSSRKQAAVGD